MKTFATTLLEICSDFQVDAVNADLAPSGGAFMLDDNIPASGTSNAKPNESRISEFRDG